MKGSNTIELNEATMIEAVQHYFETVLFNDGHAPKVEAVEQGLTGKGYESRKCFRIDVVEPEPSAPPDTGTFGAGA
jgi:hypothetical protein